MNTRIEKLYRYPEKKMPPVQESELVLCEGKGVEGDCHADGGDRQVSLLTVSEKEWMERQEKPGFCFRKYKENILFGEGFLNSCKSGDLLDVEGTVLELTDSIKSCHPDLCHLVKKGNCILAGSSRFAKVKRGGTIRVGMQVRMVSGNGKEGQYE